MAFSDRVDTATEAVKQASSIRTDLRNAFDTFQSSCATVFTTYGLKDQDKQAFDDKVIDIARFLESAMRV